VTDGAPNRDRKGGKGREKRKQPVNLNCQFAKAKPIEVIEEREEKGKKGEKRNSSSGGKQTPTARKRHWLPEGGHVWGYHLKKKRGNQVKLCRFVDRATQKKGKEGPPKKGRETKRVADQSTGTNRPVNGT